LRTQESLPTEDQVVERLGASSRGPLKAKELARSFTVSSEDYRDFRALLRAMERSGRLYRVKGGRYAVPDRINLLVGRLTVIRSGDGFVASDDPSRQDVFVPAVEHGSAMDGDQVVVRIEGRPRGRNPEGRIIKVLERAHPTVVGTFRRGRKLAYVEPRDRRVTRDVLIPAGEERDAREGDLVVVRIVHFGDRKLNPLGEIETVLGPGDERGVDILAILYEYGLPVDFPENVERAAAEIAERGRPAPEKGRVDRRDLHAFTIDPADAKDHDDALSIGEAGEGLWEVGVHIADVSWYVDRGGAVDLEGLNRGTSVYLVDRVIPMLPHVLSSDLCSLRANEDRFALSLFAILDARGRVRSFRFERTLIRSRHRLDYEQVQRVLDGEEVIDDATDEALGRLDELARALRRSRAERGSLDFDLPEARIVLGEEGEAVGVERVLRLDSHRLVEDFMVMANELVATEGARRRLPMLYRVHESPTREKANSLRQFLASLGHALPRGDIRPRDLRNVIERVHGRPEERLISMVMLRSMQRARYAVENLGHFGLAASNYAHFTSPIRRYPDLVTHRVVVRALVEGRPIPEEWGGTALEEIAERTSARERTADEAERDSVELKKIELMESRLGETFDGVVSGVTAFGFFVLLDAVFVEGLVHVNSLHDDYYEFRDREYALVGDRKGRRFRLGDRVRIEVARVDRGERHVDFVLLDQLQPERGAGENPDLGRHVV
jgi:ribonuclease R